MSLREIIARRLCPEVFVENERYFQMWARASEARRWLGEFPAIDAVTSRILATLGSDQSDMWDFRESLRRAALQHREKTNG